MYLLGAARWTSRSPPSRSLGGGLGGLVIAVLRVSPARAGALARASATSGDPGHAAAVPGCSSSISACRSSASWSTRGSRRRRRFAIYAGAFLGEIWRGALRRSRATQWEAAASLGLGFLEQLRYIIVPQAVRIAIPPTVGFLVQLIKNTSLAAIIGFVELTREAQITNASTFQPMTVFVDRRGDLFRRCASRSRSGAAYLERRLHVAR